MAVTAAERHERHELARGQSIAWMTEAARRGDYLEAAEWLDALTVVDGFAPTTEAIVERWRYRAARLRGADPATPQTAGDDGPSTYRGLFAGLLAGARDGILVTCAEHGWILECSASVTTLTGYARAEVLGRTPQELGLDGAGAERGGHEAPVLRKDGAERWIEFSPEVVLGAGLRLTSLRDVTDARVRAEELRRLADHDPLTGLLNRRRLHEEIDRRLGEARRYGTAATLMIVDVDDFKAINDRHGHPVGDQVLCSVASAIQGTVRATDLVARLGGDEFAVLLTHADPEACRRVASDITRRLAVLTIDEREATIGVTAAIGAARLDADVADVAEVLTTADRAMYARKRRGAGG